MVAQAGAPVRQLIAVMRCNMAAVSGCELLETAMHPDRLDVSLDQTHLVVRWADGEMDLMAAPFLRAHARDAASVRFRMDHGAIEPPETLTIAAVEPIGAMGVNITFSDGHDRAIYPWPYLRELAAQKRN
jgi:DUF971 family protein